MTEKYYITGIQLGMLKAFIISGDETEGQNLIDGIIDNQFIESEVEE